MYCCKKGASAPFSLLYISVILYQNQFTCLSVQLHQCYFISVLLYINVALYQHYSLSTLLYISIVSVEESSESGDFHQHILKHQPTEQCTGDAEQHVGDVVMA